jgi:hypothetical protein
MACTAFHRMLNGLRGEGAQRRRWCFGRWRRRRARLHVEGAASPPESAPAVVARAQVWGARAELMPASARRLSARELEDTLLRAVRVDRMIKGLSRGDVWDELLRSGCVSSVRHAMSDRIAVESSLLRRQTQMDIQSYMHGVGRGSREGFARQWRDADTAARIGRCWQWLLRSTAKRNACWMRTGATSMPRAARG